MLYHGEPGAAAGLSEHGRTGTGENCGLTANVAWGEWDESALEPELLHNVQKVLLQMYQEEGQLL